MKLLQTITMSQEQKYLRLKTKDQDVILSECIDLRIAMDGNDLFIVGGEECSTIILIMLCC